MKKKLIYSGLTVLCFLACILILLFFKNNNFIRGFIGDLIIVIMIYFFIKIFYNFNPLVLALIVLVFSYSIEFLQYFKMGSYFNLADNYVFKIIFGTVFDFFDLLSYTIGVFIAYFIDAIIINKSVPSK